MGAAGTGEDLTVRALRPDEIAWAVDLAAKEGWNPGLHDTPCFHAADPGGFLVGEIGGDRVGCVSAVRYGNDHAFLGFFIVRPEYRGHGYGGRLWAAALARVEGRVVGLDGVPQMEETYRRSGFQSAYADVRFCREPVGGRAGGRTPAAARSRAMELDGAGVCALRPVAEVSRDSLLAYDRRCFPAERTAFLECWLSMPRSTALCALRDGRLCGYGVIRECMAGHKIGPLFADDADAAERLFLALCASVPDGDPVYLDVPEVNAAGMALAEAHGLWECFRTIRMYLGPEPAIALDKVFGVTSFELG
jgi:GNAT superfamily N-acetyltransferase